MKTYNSALKALNLITEGLMLLIKTQETDIDVLKGFDYDEKLELFFEVKEFKDALFETAIQSGQLNTEGVSDPIVTALDERERKGACAAFSMAQSFINSDEHTVFIPKGMNEAAAKIGWGRGRFTIRRKS